jgi:hypothetical protein
LSTGHHKLRCEDKNVKQAHYDHSPEPPYNFLTLSIPHA